MRVVIDVYVLSLAPETISTDLVAELFFMVLTVNCSTSLLVPRCDLLAPMSTIAVVAVEEDEVSLRLY